MCQNLLVQLITIGVTYYVKLLVLVLLLVVRHNAYEPLKIKIYIYIYIHVSINYETCKQIFRNHLAITIFALVSKLKRHYTICNASVIMYVVEDF